LKKVNLCEMEVTGLPLLGYSKWDKFQNVIEKAKAACVNAGEKPEDHFPQVEKMVEIGSGAFRPLFDILLTRYASYLIAQNGDANKPEIAFAQNYFAVQTRRAELVEQRLLDYERVQARAKLAETEKILSGVLYERGVDSKGFAVIRSKGDKALFKPGKTLLRKSMLTTILLLERCLLGVVFILSNFPQPKMSRR
jgi:DNA-damage-inducible protein D